MNDDKMNHNSDEKEDDSDDDKVRTHIVIKRTGNVKICDRFKWIQCSVMIIINLMESEMLKTIN